MRATKIVYTLITILILIPIFVRRIKGARNAIKLDDRALAKRQILYLIIVCSIVLAFTISLYSFTIKYEVPLVAEQISDIFVSCIRRDVSQEEFENMLYEKKLISTLESLEYEGVLDSIDLNRSYEIYLSERTYRDDGKEIIYCKYTQDEKNLYIKMGLDIFNARWRLSTFNAADEEEIKNIDSKMKFFRIK